jgi:hypothetical protein
MIACQQTTRRSDSRWTRGGLALACALVLGAGCKAPKILCTTAHAGGGTPFAVRYTLVQGSGECADLKGGLVGVDSYVRGGPEQAPSFSKPPVAIRAEEVGDLVASYTAEPEPPMVPDGGTPPDTAPPVMVTVPATKMLSSFGEFIDERPGDDGFCKVGPMTPVTLDLPKVDEDRPAVKVAYEWSNVAFYVSPRLIGTQFTSDLKYTKNGCTATYKVVGLYPGVHCEKMAMCAGQDDPVPTGMPDPAACAPCADVAGGRATGSGISPDIETVCESAGKAGFLCLPKAAPPSLNPTPVSCGATSTPAPTGDGAAVAPPPSSFMCPDAAPGADDASGGGGGDTAPASGDTPAASDTAASGDVGAGG